MAGIKTKFNPLGTLLMFPNWGANVLTENKRYVSYSISSTHDCRSYWVDYGLVKPYPKGIKLKIDLTLDRTDVRYYDKRQIYFYNKSGVQIGVVDFARTTSSYCEFTPPEDVYSMKVNLGDWYRTGGWAVITNIKR